jgi:enoyl-CoA hydratase
MTHDVIIGREGGCGRITLNRPKALHALTLGMCQDIIAALQAWETDSDTKAVVIDHSGGRGFCAGGDIRLLYESLKGGGKDADAFFRTEYRMDNLLFGFAKPAVCFMDGIVMGGGAGLAMACRYRIATEATAFAMPETGIGLFPDVGGGWFLSRLPGRVGEWLALTGARLDGADCLTLGLATHYLPSNGVKAVKTPICETPEAIDAILHGDPVELPPARIDKRRTDIDRLFAAGRLEDIVAVLKADPSQWAAEQLAEIAKKSPVSCKVALRLLWESRGLTQFSNNMRMEYRIVSRLIRNPDFGEGVRAFVIDKDNHPRWTPARFEDVSDADVDAIFAALPDDEEWTPLGRD